MPHLKSEACSALAKFYRSHYLGLMLSVLGYAAYHVVTAGVGLDGVDEPGYWGQGARLAYFGDANLKLTSVLQYAHVSWVGNALTGEFHCKYPPGFPLLIAVGVRLTGEHLALYLPIVGASVALWLTFVVGRNVLGEGVGGLLSVLATCACPTFNSRTDAGDAHMWVCSIYLGALALLTSSKLRMVQPKWLCAGLLLGAIPAFRYADVVLLPGALTVGFLVSRRRAEVPRSAFLWLLSGALVALGCLSLWLVVSGVGQRSGYSWSGEHVAFFGPWTISHLSQYTYYLSAFGVGTVLVLGVIGFGALAKGRSAPFAIGSGVGFLGSLVCYSAYYWAPQADPQSTLRFLLPNIPPLCVLAVGVGKLIFKSPTSKVIGFAILFTLQVLSQGRNIAVSVEVAGYTKGVVRAVQEAVEKAVPRGAVLVGPSDALAPLDYAARWRLVSSDLFSSNMPGTFEGVNVPIPVQPGRDESRWGNFRDLRPHQRAEVLRTELERWGGQNIYVLGGQVSEMALYLEGCRELVRQALPKVPDLAEPEGAFGALVRIERDRTASEDPIGSRLPIGLNPRHYPRSIGETRSVAVFRCQLHRPQ
ncbi:MAG: glycosyltransferase family 39 protein [Polyangiaceae bacterium]|nr:glycosyltransferase family 39 protein [Polyangiaceae bacterium]